MRKAGLHDLNKVKPCYVTARAQDLRIGLKVVKDLSGCL
jgi:hypothetical protein